MTLFSAPTGASVIRSAVQAPRMNSVMERWIGSCRRELHFEDFGPGNARRILQTYGVRYRIFNDDIQGTGAITLAAMLSAVRVSGVPMRDQKLVVFGAGTAGVGIADQLRDAMIRDGAAPEQAIDPGDESPDDRTRFLSTAVSAAADKGG